MTGTIDLSGLSASDRRALHMARRHPRLGTRLHRVVLRLSRGRIDPHVALLTTTGRRTGKLRTVPVMHVRDGTRILIVAMNNGFDPHPGWFHNLRANHRATVTVGGTVFDVTTRVVSDPERAALWPRLVGQQPAWAAFQAYTHRPAPVVELIPI